MKNEAAVKICACLCIAAIVIAALINGIDSVITGAGAFIIGGIAGYELKRRKDKNEQK